MQRKEKQALGTSGQMEKQDVQRTEINKGKLISAIGAIAWSPKSKLLVNPVRPHVLWPLPPRQPQGGYWMKTEKKKSDSHVAASYFNATGQDSAPSPSLE